MKENKTLKIKEALLKGLAITSLSAYAIARTTRISAIVYNLRYDYGLPIKTGTPDEAYSDGVINYSERCRMMLDYDNSHFAVYYIPPTALQELTQTA